MNLNSSTCHVGRRHGAAHSERVHRCGHPLENDRYDACVTINGLGLHRDFVFFYLFFLKKKSFFRRRARRVDGREGVRDDQNVVPVRAGPGTPRDQDAGRHCGLGHQLFIPHR